MFLQDDRLAAPPTDWRFTPPEEGSIGREAREAFQERQRWQPQAERWYPRNPPRDTPHDVALIVAGGIVGAIGGVVGVVVFLIAAGTR